MSIDINGAVSQRKRLSMESIEIKIFDAADACPIRTATRQLLNRVIAGNVKRLV